MGVGERNGDSSPNPYVHVSKASEAKRAERNRACLWAYRKQIQVIYQSNRSFNIPPPPPQAYLGHLTPLPSRGGWNLIIRVFLGVGNLIPMCEGWGIWTAPLISCEISSVTSYHRGRGVRGFLWKRLCLCAHGQLVTRKGLKQALCHIWRYLNLIFLFNIFIFIFGFRLWIYECIKLCLRWNRIPIPAIQ